jgi:hypothetical protein
MMNKFIQLLYKTWDWVLLAFAAAFAMVIFKGGVWIMDHSNPLVMLLGFIVCSSAVLTFSAVVFEFVDRVRNLKKP